MLEGGVLKPPPFSRDVSTLRRFDASTSRSLRYFAPCGAHIGKAQDQRAEPKTQELKPKTAEVKPKTHELKPKTAELKPKTAELKPKSTELKP